MSHSRAIPAIDPGSAARRAPRRLADSLTLGFAVFQLFAISAQAQTILDAVTPEPEEQAGRHAVSSNVPSSTKHPALPIEVTVRDLSPVVAAYGDRITVLLQLRNTGREPLTIPCSRNFNDVAAAGNQDQRDLAAVVRLVEGKIPVDIVVAVFGGSASVAGSMCSMPPGGTILIRGQGDIYSQAPLEDPRVAATTLNARASVHESYYDASHTQINFSQDCVSINSVPVYFLGKKPRP